MAVAVTPALIRALVGLGLQVVRHLDFQSPLEGRLEDFPQQPVSPVFEDHLQGFFERHTLFLGHLLLLSIEANRDINLYLGE